MVHLCIVFVMQGVLQRHNPSLNTLQNSSLCGSGTNTLTCFVRGNKSMNAMTGPLQFSPSIENHCI